MRCVAMRCAKRRMKNERNDSRMGRGRSKAGRICENDKNNKKKCRPNRSTKSRRFFGEKTPKERKPGDQVGIRFFGSGYGFFRLAFFFLSLVNLFFVTLSPCLVISPVLVLVFHPWRWVATCNLQGVIKPPRRQVDTRAHLPPGGTSLES